MKFSVNGTLLEACILSILSEGDTYGYALTQKLRQMVDISESTLYPVLRRLLDNTYLSTYDEPLQGRNRRFYHLTETGEAALAAYRRDWNEYKQLLDGIFSVKEDGR